jgi:hypothetical protein
MAEDKAKLEAKKKGRAQGLTRRTESGSSTVDGDGEEEDLGAQEWEEGDEEGAEGGSVRTRTAGTQDGEEVGVAGEEERVAEIVVGVEKRADVFVVESPRASPRGEAGGGVVKAGKAGGLDEVRLVLEKAILAAKAEGAKEVGSAQSTTVDLLQHAVRLLQPVAIDAGAEEAAAKSVEAVGSDVSVEAVGAADAKDAVISQLSLEVQSLRERLALVQGSGRAGIESPSAGIGDAARRRETSAEQGRGAGAVTGKRGREGEGRREDGGCCELEEHLTAYTLRPNDSATDTRCSIISGFRMLSLPDSTCTMSCARWSRKYCNTSYAWGDGTSRAETRNDGTSRAETSKSRLAAGGICRTCFGHVRPYTE